LLQTGRIPSFPGCSGLLVYPMGNWDENSSDRAVNAFGPYGVEVMGWADVTDGWGVLVLVMPARLYAIGRSLVLE
jgi:hypothetical protein